jgi:hypothetical protein
MISPYQTIDNLLISYVPLLTHPCVINSENARVILNNITMDLVYKQLLVIQKDFRENIKSDE